MYDKNGREIPKIKLSENVAKTQHRAQRNVYRLYENETHKAIADVLTLEKEDAPSGEYEIFDPEHTWKRKTITDFYAKNLLVKIFDKGKRVYDLPDIESIKQKCKIEVDNLWDEVKRWENPHNYYVDLSLDLWKIKDELLNKKSF